MYVSLTDSINLHILQKEKQGFHDKI